MKKGLTFLFFSVSERRQRGGYETSFSRLRTQGPQTPGKLHEMNAINKEPKLHISCLILHAPVLFPTEGMRMSVSLGKRRSTLIQSFKVEKVLVFFKRKKKRKTQKQKVYFRNCLFLSFQFLLNFQFKKQVKQVREPCQNLYLK